MPTLSATPPFPFASLRRTVRYNAQTTLLLPADRHHEQVAIALLNQQRHAPAEP